jgi:hypothetical protein
MVDQKSTLVVAIDGRKAVAGSAQVQGALTGIAGKVQKTGRAFSVMRGLALSSFTIMGGSIVRRAIKNVSDQERATSQLVAGLRSTNFVSGQTVEGLQDLAKEMQLTTGLSNELIESVAGIGLSFTNISGDVFPQFLKISADVAERMGVDLRSTAVQLAKALNDPVANLGALSRAGIQFSKSQKAVITDLFETGKVAEAQTVVLEELRRQYEGSAFAARDTLGGALKGLNEDFQDFLKSLAQANSVGLRKFIEGLGAVFRALSGSNKALNTFTGNIQKFVNGITTGVAVGIQVFTGFAALVGGAIRLAIANISNFVSSTMASVSNTVRSLTIETFNLVANMAEGVAGFLQNRD